MIGLTGHGPRIRSHTMAMMAVSCAAGALALSHSARAEGSKEQTYNAMIAMAQQMSELRPQIATNPAAASLYQQLQAAYKAGSEQLGGGDPGRLYSKRPKPSVNQTPSGLPAVVGQRNDGGLAGTGITPPGCPAASVIWPTPAAVPLVDGGTITSTITVSGMSGVVWYVDSIQNITHTWSSDLDVTLTSPSGTTVTITTDNGGSNDNVFAGTYWRDSANPGGALPYATNNGVVTDHAYVDLVTAFDMCPEEPLNAFVGEDPNGDWTLTVTDDVLTDTGTLNAWDLLVITSPAPTTETTRTFVGPSFPVIDAGVNSATVGVGGMAGYVCDVDVRVNLTHTWNSDVDMTLTSPSGTVVTLTTDNAGTADNVYAGTLFDDDGNPGPGFARQAADATYVDLVAKNVLVPEEGLSTFRGEPANGPWTLTVSDDTAIAGGTVNSWAVTVTTCSCGPACPGDINGDGVTNVTDLLAVIAAWGNCP